MSQRASLPGQSYVPSRSANRIWQSYFGIGIVDTPEDFGTQSQAPSHPQLLDWLACELMDHRWSLKHIHRLITLSTTYRQSSRMTPELRERDPYNRWLARSSRVRVDAESERIRYAFRRTLGREPAPAETAELNALLERAKTHIRDGWVSAVELASGHNEPLSALPPGVTPTELAAYTVVTRALLNLDETITRE